MTQEHSQMIYKTFDQPIRILLWTFDEFIVLFPLCLVGVFLKSFFLLVLVVILNAVYKNVKKKFHNQSISHFFYRNFPTDVCQKIGFFEGLPPSYLKSVLLT